MESCRAVNTVFLVRIPVTEPTKIGSPRKGRAARNLKFVNSHASHVGQGYSMGMDITRYDWSGGWNPTLVRDKDGDYVLHDDAQEIVVAKDARIQELQAELEKLTANRDFWHDACQAAWVHRNIASTLLDMAEKELAKNNLTLP